ncbi:hypothetical protein MalM25_25070 [Planctomycetes bacterium MalM25]|nr:hypothetical protein MalM25_25070 [Planctomycetes bacterium MalM25]
MSMHGNPQQDSLSPERMQLFLAGLAGLPEDEVRKAKVLYLKNAISEYEAMLESLKAFGCLQIAFAIIPIFWPILWMQRKGMNAGKKLMRERIENAMEVWRDDLRGEVFDWPPVS